jgi:Protein of unknown function (DUF3179)
MKKLFYLAILALLAYEIAKVYFIMPMPGSQDMNSLDLAYALHNWRWPIRGACVLLIALGLRRAFAGSKWLSASALLLAIGLVYAVNFKMAADTMFYQPQNLHFGRAEQHKVELDRLVLGVVLNGEAKAYPIQFLGYHHQVRDVLGGQPIMVTYCTVCRTGRVYEPKVQGRITTFRLVGMDHFNAMFEDRATRSWWRQVNGEAVAGKLKGQSLPEVPAVQITLRKWLELQPQSLVMQPDQHFQVEYDSMSIYEKGKLSGTLTRRDTASWQEKSWVVGVLAGGKNKAYDWNRLQKMRIIHDRMGAQPLLLVLGEDGQSFAAFAREGEERFTLRGDTLLGPQGPYDLLGRALQKGSPDLKRLRAYQEYWHSWQAFHGE